MGKEGPPTSPEITEFRPEKIKGKFKGIDVYSGEQFDRRSLEIVIGLTPQMEYIAKNAVDSRMLGGTMTGLFFHEVSTRTKLSFDTGIKQLGGQTTTEYTPSLSESKGEPYGDTIETAAAYCDAIVTRHPNANAIRIAMDVADIPIINGGNGNDQHPTQGLGDLSIIRKSKGHLDGLRGLVARDILNSRTAHSFFDEIAAFSSNIIYAYAPEELQIPDSEVKRLEKRGLKIIKIDKESDIPRDLDYWYINRVQKARLEHPERDFERLDQQCIVDNDFLAKYGNEKLIVLHAMPIGKEITKQAQKDPRMVIKDQVRHCQYARMALMALVLGKINPDVIK